MPRRTILFDPPGNALHADLEHEPERHAGAAELQQAAGDPDAHYYYCY